MAQTAGQWPPSVKAWPEEGLQWSLRISRPEMSLLRNEEWEAQGKQFTNLTSWAFSRYPDQTPEVSPTTDWSSDQSGSLLREGEVDHSPLGGMAQPLKEVFALKPICNNNFIFDKQTQIPFFLLYKPQSKEAQQKHSWLEELFLPNPLAENPKCCGREHVPLESPYHIISRDVSLFYSSKVSMYSNKSK